MKIKTILQKVSSAFSLIELMISLITISCITAAFTPIITKKLKNSNISVALSEISTKCQTKFTDQCSLCYSQKCVVCTRSCGEYQYKNTGTCQCENCSDRGVGCAWCDGKYCTQCHQGYGYDSATHSCTLCKAGTYSDGTKPCEPCPAGSYANTDGANQCTPCPEGQYQPQTGQIGCGWCGAAKWSNSDRTGCEPCPKGHECHADATKKPCDPGYYSQGGLEACTACPAGQYQNQTGQEGCGCCPQHRWSYGGASSCTACPAGYQCDGSCKIKACSGGYYSLGGYSSTPTCTSCPENQWSNDNHTGCKWCDAGYQCSKNGNIEACTAGHYSEGGGSSVPKCKACPAGTYQPATGQPGCGWCDAGTWSGEAAIECKSEWCGAGWACHGNATASQCQAGTYSTGGASSCSNCKPGQWSNAGSSSCYACGAGWACPGNGTAYQCTGSTYSNAGQSSCSNCTNWNAKCTTCNQNGCTACASGYRVSGTGCVANITCEGGGGLTMCEGSGVWKRGEQRYLCRTFGFKRRPNAAGTACEVYDCSLGGDDWHWGWTDEAGQYGCSF